MQQQKEFEKSKYLILIPKQRLFKDFTDLQQTFEIKKTLIGLQLYYFHNDTNLLFPNRYLQTLNL